MQPRITNDFITQFSEVVAVNFAHNYFSNDMLKFFDVKPSLETSKLFKSYGLLFRKTNNGFVLLSGFEERIRSTAFNGSVRFSFTLHSKDPYFINYTEIDYDSDLKLVLSNDFSNGYLHKSKYVDSSRSSKKDKQQLADILLNFTENNGFFGLPEKNTTKFPLRYTISFDSRKILIRYNFVTQSPKGMEGFFITNEDNQEITDSFDKRNLASGREVFYFCSNNLVQCKEFYDFRYYLKKQQDFFMSFELPLAHPTKNNISFDLNKKAFIADVFVNLD